MGTTTRRNSNAPISDGEEPLWLRPIVNFCGAIYLVALILGFVGLLGALLLVLLGKVDFAWLSRVPGLVMLALALGVIAIQLKFNQSLAPGWVFLVLGLLFAFGGDFLVAFLAGRGGADINHTFVATLVKTVKDVGVLMAVVASIRLLVGGYQWYKDEHGAARKKKFKYMDLSKDDAGKVGFIPKCWQMSRCRPAVRMSCPNYIDRKTCWSRRSGCFCDRELANYLLQSVDRGETTEVTEVQSHAPVASRGRRPWKLQKSLCYNCPLFIEHQEYKFNHLRWISLPITLAIGGALWTPYQMGFVILADKVAEFSEWLVKLGNLPENFRPAVTDLQGTGFEYFLGAVLLLLISSYVMALTERMFLKWNL